MGIYDTIFLKNIKCPYCGEVSKIDFQTKDGDPAMHEYYVGDVFKNGQFKFINGIGSCESLTCQFEAAKESVWKYGYFGGFSRSFDAKIFCDSKGRITNKIKILGLNDHKGIMHGKLGELKGKEDNMKVVEYGHYDRKKKKWIEAKMEPMTTDGWLDKFRKDSVDGGERYYEKILYLYNLNDSEEAMKYWFVFRYKLDRIIRYFIKELKIRKEEDFASVFLSNNPEDLIKWAGDSE